MRFSMLNIILHMDIKNVLHFSISQNWLTINNNFIKKNDFKI